MRFRERYSVIPPATVIGSGNDFHLALEAAKPAFPFRHKRIIGGCKLGLFNSQPHKHAAPCGDWSCFRFPLNFLISQINHGHTLLRLLP